jgi:hypothetical protein
VYVSGLRNTRWFLEWIVAQIKGKYLMLVPETADGFRLTIGTLSSLDEGQGVSFHTF